MDISGGTPVKEEDQVEGVIEEPSVRGIGAAGVGEDATGER